MSVEAYNISTGITSWLDGSADDYVVGMTVKIEPYTHDTWFDEPALLGVLDITDDGTLVVCDVVDVP